VTRRLRAFERQFPRALDGQAEGVHQARVASRRLRELLPVVVRSFDDEDVRELRRDVRDITRALGPVRELDVALLSLADVAARSPQHAGALAVVRARFEEERGDAARYLDQLRDVDVRRLAFRIRSLVPLRPTPAAVRRCAARIAERIKTRSLALRRAVDACGTLFSMDQLHGARIALKKFRYALELGEHAGRFRLAATMRQLKTVQDGLGHIHDLHVLAARIRNCECANPSIYTALEQVALGLDEDMRRLHADFLAERHRLDSVIATAGRVRIQLGVLAVPLSPATGTAPRAGGAFQRRAG
jgi:CHAD domain-containing protein